MPTNKNIYDQVSDLVSEGELDDAIDLLREHLRKQTKDQHNLYEEAVVLDGQLSEWKRDSRMGLAPSEARYSRLQIAILQLAKESVNPKPAPTPSKKDDKDTTITKTITVDTNNKPNYLLYGLLTAGILLLGVLLWRSFPEETPKEKSPKKETPTNTPTTAGDTPPLDDIESKNTFGTDIGHASTATDMAIAQGKKQFFGKSIWESNVDRWGRIEFNSLGAYAKWRHGTIKFYDIPQRGVLRGEVVNYQGKNTDFYMTAVSQNELKVAIGQPNATPQIWKRK
ncbi:MAG: hypothetical protein AB8G22_26570 [Saprospiraceae bacterium]